MRPRSVCQAVAQFFYDRDMTSLWKSTAVTLEMIKWEHSVFALPFALTGAVLAAGGWPQAACAGLDRRVYGGGAVGGDGFQSPGGRTN